MHSNDRNKLILITVMCLLALFLLGGYLHQTVYQKYVNRSEELDEKFALLEKYKKVISGSDAVKEKEESLRKLFSDVKSRIMKVSSKSIALVKLQENIKEISNKANINITRYQDMDTYEFSHYMKVGAQVMTVCKMRELNDFLFLLQTDDTYLTVSEMNINTLGGPTGVKVTLKIFSIADTAYKGEL